MAAPSLAHADSALVPDAADALAPSAADVSAAQIDGRSAIQAAAEITKHFSEVSPYVDSIGEMSVSIENIAAEQERQKAKEIELARVEAGVKAAQEEHARIAEEERREAEAAAVRQQFVDTALAQVGTAYVSGGAAPGGFDCSGLVKYCVAQVYGYEMPRTAAGQSGEGERHFLRRSARRRPAVLGLRIGGVPRGYLHRRRPIRARAAPRPIREGANPGKLHPFFR